MARPAKFVAAERAITTAMVAKWWWACHFANQDFSPMVQ